jgi:hypothetical protein
VHAYNSASSVLKKLGDPALAALAADRAIQVARQVEDPLLVAASAYRLANVFLPAGRLAETREVALSGAALLEPSVDSSRVQMATWGGLVQEVRPTFAQARWESGEVNRCCAREHLTTGHLARRQFQQRGPAVPIKPKIVWRPLRVDIAGLDPTHFTDCTSTLPLTALIAQAALCHTWHVRDWIGVLLGCIRPASAH